MIKETCANCCYYIATLGDNESSFHIHDYCTVWKTEIPRFTILDRNMTEEDEDKLMFDDIECGIAKCWCFEPVEDENIKTYFYRNN